MTHPIYRPYSRANNQALIKSLVYPQGKNPMVRACTAHQADFTPSLYAELDWQRFRPDTNDPNLQQILDAINDLLFIVGFPTNMLVREQGGEPIRLQPAELSRLEPIFDAWQDMWMTPERESVLASFRRFVEGLRNPPRRALEAGLREHALSQLGRALADIADQSNLLKTAEQILLNAQYAFLDLPWTRQAVRDSLIASQDPAALVSLFPSTAVEQPDLSALAAHLRRRANCTSVPGAEEWARLLREAADRIANVDPRELTGDDGDWTDSRSVCGSCAMWFAGRTVTAMDDRASFAQGTPKPIIYLPHDTMVCCCPFCGFAAPNSVPAFYFAEQRGQVIYLAPSRDGVSKSEALVHWTPAIQDLQKRYLKGRNGISQVRFSAAAELVTHDLAEFFYAIQMGDTIAEDHVFNFADVEDGYALIFDGEKGFGRVLTPGEAMVFRAHQRVKDGLHQVSAVLSKEIRPGRVLKLDEVEGVLDHLARVNAALDAELGAPRRERKENLPDA